MLHLSALTPIKKVSFFMMGEKNQNDCDLVTEESVLSRLGGWLLRKVPDAEKFTVNENLPNNRRDE